MNILYDIFCYIIKKYSVGNDKMYKEEYNGRLSVIFGVESGR